MRAGRLELPRPLGQQILSLPRLPFRHARRLVCDYTRAPGGRLAIAELVHGCPSAVTEPLHDRVLLRQRPNNKDRGVDDAVG